jgi:ATP-dependent DNA ligase
MHWAELCFQMLAEHDPKCPISDRTNAGRSPVLYQSSGSKADLPRWVKPQFSELVKQPPDGSDWFHEIKFDGYRIHARIEAGDIKLLTRTGLDWTHKYPPIAAALKGLSVGNAYLDGELCGVRPDGTTSFGMIQAASESGNADALVFFVFDLLFLEGEDLAGPSHAGLGRPVGGVGAGRARR